MDIQAKLQAGKGPGYGRWAKVFNLKQMAQTINFLTENNITDYETLVEKTKAATDRYYELSQQIKEIEKRMADIAELKKHIVNYSKTKEIYAAYRKSGYSTKFYESNAGDILLYQSARRAYDSVSAERKPTLKGLQDDYSKCIKVKQKIAKDYYQSRIKMKQSVVAKSNIDKILNSNKFEKLTQSRE